MKATLTLAALAAALSTAGCAHDANLKLIDAESQLHAAQADPTVVSKAPVPLHEAEQSVAAARAAYDADAEQAKVDHLAYLGARRVEIARAIAARNAAKAEVEALGRDREMVVVDARTAEANKARAEAEEAREQAQLSALTAEALASELSALQAKETDRGLVLTLGDVLFDVDRAEPKPGALTDLQRLADLLKTDPERSVLIEGHTDSTGPAQHNDELSRQRADAVASVLIRDGVDPSRIQTRGFGSSAPLATNSTEAGRQQNRRVEIVVLDQAS